MKKITAAAIALCMFFTLMLTAIASSPEYKPGDKLYIGVDEFRDSTHDAPPPYSLNKENYALGFRFASGGGTFVSSVYMDEDSQCVIIELKGGASLSKDKRLSGTLTLKDKEKGGLRYVYELDAIVQSMDVVNMDSYDGKDTYSLPYNYQTSIIRFRDDSDDNSSNKVYRFIAEFGSDAYFSAKILGQGNLYLGYEKNDNLDFMKKYPDANLRFIRWYDQPKFSIAGDLTIKCRSSEYVYRILGDGTLQKFGSYSSADRGYTAKTDTLGYYVISDRPLSATAAPSQPEQNQEGSVISKNPNTGR